jgi:hypothetical protein
MNAWVEQYLRLWTSTHPHDWARLLPMAEYTHNSWKHDGTRKSPHELLIGIRPQVNIKLIDEQVPAVLDRLKDLEEARAIAQKHLETIQQKKDKKLDVKYQEGDQVWLEGKNLSIKGQQKLMPKHYGPFRIKEKVSSVAFRLELPPSMRIHNVFHADLLLPYKETEAYGTPFT